MNLSEKIIKNFPIETLERGMPTGMIKQERWNIIKSEDVKEAVKELRKVFHTLCSAEIPEHILNSIFGEELVK